MKYFPQKTLGIILMLLFCNEIFSKDRDAIPEDYEIVKAISECPLDEKLTISKIKSAQERGGLTRGFRYLEAFIIALLVIIAGCFAVEMALAQPEIGAVLAGYIPSTEIVTNPAMLYIAIGILGATVMPHNLYLHSAIVKTRNYGEDTNSKREAIKFGTIDSTVALMFALLINSAILIMAAATFHTNGMTEVAEIQDAHK